MKSRDEKMERGKWKQEEKPLVGAKDRPFKKEFLEGQCINGVFKHIILLWVQYFGDEF